MRPGRSFFSCSAKFPNPDSLTSAPDPSFGPRSNGFRRESNGSNIHATEIFDSVEFRMAEPAHQAQGEAREQTRRIQEQGAALESASAKKPTTRRRG